MKNQGFPSNLFDGRPVIGICNTWSELVPCNAHFRLVADRVKRGIYEAGGFPLEFPVMSLGETNMRPTAMLFRNLVSMDVEESIRGNPIDGVVLLCGCDKTTPSLMMGAASCDLPALVVSGGAMLNGNFRGQPIGSGTSVWQMSEDVRAGKMSCEDFADAESCMSRSAGHCMTMGTASTMACMVEALGMGMPQNAAIPAVDSRRYVLAQEAGRRIVEMVRDNVKMSQILTRKAFENAIRVNAAIGGSTNAVLHLLALAGRVGVKLDLDDFDRLGHELPLLVDLMPSGKFLMEDFYYAGGVPAVVRALGELIHKDALTVNGKTMGENTANAPCWNAEVIHGRENPIREHAGIAVLRGNLAPGGALIKPSAATPSLLKHRGRAVVFKDIEDFKERIDDPALDIDENSVMVLQVSAPACSRPCSTRSVCRNGRHCAVCIAVVKCSGPRWHGASVRNRVSSSRTCTGPLKRPSMRPIACACPRTASRPLRLAARSPTPRSTSWTACCSRSPSGAGRALHRRRGAGARVSEPAGADRGEVHSPIRSRTRRGHGCTGPATSRATCATATSSSSAGSIIR